MIEKAVRLEPENGAYLDSYGGVLYRLKRYREAEEQVRRALEKTNDDSTVYDHLGDICKAQGKLEEAGENWRKTLELDPQNERVKEKLKEQSQ